MTTEPAANSKVLAWLANDERRLCPACGERARFDLEDVEAWVCFNCGASEVDPVHPRRLAS